MNFNQLQSKIGKKYFKSYYFIVIKSYKLKVKIYVFKEIF